MVPFAFNKLIDRAVLETFYENDLTLIQKIFNSFLNSGIDEDIQLIERCFASGDLDGLRKVIHKIKPAFGFVGMPAIEEKCRNLEVLCTQVRSTKDLTENVKDLLPDLRVAKIAIEE